MDDIEKAAQIISRTSDQPVIVLTDWNGILRLTTSYKDAQDWIRNGFVCIAMYEKGARL